MSIRNPQIKGRCPACRNALLFLGDGGHITCSWFECANPGAAGQLLDAWQAIEHTPAFADGLERLIDVFRSVEEVFVKQ